MNVQILFLGIVVLAAASVTVLLLTQWRSRRTCAQRGADGRQEARVEVGRQSFVPSIIVATAGEPLLLTFHRRHDAPFCTGRLHLVGFGKKLTLEPEATAAVEVVAPRPGEYAFTCAHVKLKGRVVAT